MVSVTLTVTVDGMTAYIVEVQQAGIFVVQGIEGGHLAQALSAFCPNLLFPYLRETIDSVVVKGSFPAMMLAPVNFDAIYDVVSKNFNNTTFNITKDLHCWSLTARWYPIGINQGFYLRFGIKASQLRDLQIEKQSSPLFR
mgnify:CR=1 FL=1